MLTIRLQRTGKKNQADFRIVLAEKKAPVNKKFVEVLGSYNPRKKVFMAKADRMNYWVAQHVELSPTVHNLLVTNKLMEGKKVKAFNTPKKPVAPVAPETSVPVSPTAETPAEAAQAEAVMEAKIEPIQATEASAPAEAKTETVAVPQDKPAESKAAEATPAPEAQV